MPVPELDAEAAQAASAAAKAAAEAEDEARIKRIQQKRQETEGYFHLISIDSMRQQASILICRKERRAVEAVEKAEKAEEKAKKEEERKKKQEGQWTLGSCPMPPWFKGVWLALAHRKWQQSSSKVGGRHSGLFQAMETSEADCRALVVRKHDASDESQLTLKVHEVVIVLERDDSGWWGGHKEGKRKTGWFPGTCVRLEKEVQRKSVEKGLEERLQEMQRRSEEDQQRIQELQGSVAKLEAQVGDLESKLSVEEKQKSELKEELDQLRGEKGKVCDVELPTGSVRQICEVLEVRARERQDFGMSPMRLGAREKARRAPLVR